MRSRCNYRRYNANKQSFFNHFIAHKNLSITKDQEAVSVFFSENASKP
jgi:hypothetical protein